VRCLRRPLKDTQTHSMARRLRPSSCVFTLAGACAIDVVLLVLCPSVCCPLSTVLPPVVRHGLRVESVIVGGSLLSATSALSSRIVAIISVAGNTYNIRIGCQDGFAASPLPGRKRSAVCIQPAVSERRLCYRTTQGIPAQAACTLHPPPAYLPNWFAISMSYAARRGRLHMWGGLKF
jgi:hypothetical protein